MYDNELSSWIVGEQVQYMNGINVIFDYTLTPL